MPSQTQQGIARYWQGIGLVCGQTRFKPGIPKGVPTTTKRPPPAPPGVIPARRARSKLRALQDVAPKPQPSEVQGPEMEHRNSDSCLVEADPGSSLASMPRPPVLNNKKNQEKKNEPKRPFSLFFPIFKSYQVNCF